MRRRAVVAAIPTGIPIFGSFASYQNVMTKNTSILLGEHFHKFIGEQVDSGRFSTASEVVRAALRLMEEEEKRNRALRSALKHGERSGFMESIDRKGFMKHLRRKHGASGL